MINDILECILAYFSDFLFKRKFLVTVRSPAKYSDVHPVLQKKRSYFGRPLLVQNSVGFKADELSQGEKILINGRWALFPGTGSVYGVQTVGGWAIPLTDIIDIRQARSSFVCDKECPYIFRKEYFVQISSVLVKDLHQYVSTGIWKRACINIV